MIPVHFEEATGTLLGGPPEKYGVEVVDLPVRKDGVEIISAWKPTWRERFSILFYGMVWFGIRSQDTHAPIWLQGQKTAFVPRQPA